MPGCNGSTILMSCPCVVYRCNCGFESSAAPAFHKHLASFKGAPSYTLLLLHVLERYYCQQYDNLIMRTENAWFHERMIPQEYSRQVQVRAWTITC